MATPGAPRSRHALRCLKVVRKSLVLLQTRAAGITRLSLLHGRRGNSLLLIAFGSSRFSRVVNMPPTMSIA
jgi:hypothetical protein